jgi:hypothetical protein
MHSFRALDGQRYFFLDNIKCSMILSVFIRCIMPWQNHKICKSSGIRQTQESEDDVYQARGNLTTYVLARCRRSAIRSIGQGHRDLIIAMAIVRIPLAYVLFNMADVGMEKPKIIQFG